MKNMRKNEKLDCARVYRAKKKESQMEWKSQKQYLEPPLSLYIKFNVIKQCKIIIIIYDWKGMNNNC